MKGKTRHLRVRLSEDQYRWMEKVLVKENRSKSSIVRDALHMYLAEYYNKDETRKNQKASIE